LALSFFLQYWGLNSGPHTCWSGVLSLSHSTSSLSISLMLKIKSRQERLLKGSLLLGLVLQHQGAAQEGISQKVT
jgi:hypothetical protein